MPTLRVIGPGRAGTAMSRALEAAGWTIADPVRHGDDARPAALWAEHPSGRPTPLDLLLIATPDVNVAQVASEVAPVEETVVAHLAGSLTLDVLAPHVRRASMHPLRSLPSGAADVRGATFAVAGDPLAEKVVDDLGGRCFRIDDGDRAAYHAAACIASNHLVALLGQVERVGAAAGVPLSAYLDLIRQTVDNVEALGPRAALTGPVRRGDVGTVERHRHAIGDEERAAYDAMVDQMRWLVRDVEILETR